MVASGAAVARYNPACVAEYTIRIPLPGYDMVWKYLNSIAT